MLLSFQLRALQGKQESLLAMQKDAESRLKLAKARRNAGIYKFAFCVYMDGHK